LICDNNVVQITRYETVIVFCYWCGITAVIIPYDSCLAVFLLADTLNYGHVLWYQKKCIAILHYTNVHVLII
jgi:uncharacterized ion transporter superfamily protein YfcC